MTRRKAPWYFSGYHARRLPSLPTRIRTRLPFLPLLRTCPAVGPGIRRSAPRADSLRRIRSPGADRNRRDGKSIPRGATRAGSLRGDQGHSPAPGARCPGRIPVRQRSACSQPPQPPQCGGRHRLRSYRRRLAVHRDGVSAWSNAREGRGERRLALDGARGGYHASNAGGTHRST